MDHSEEPERQENSDKKLEGANRGRWCAPPGQHRRGCAHGRPTLAPTYRSLRSVNGLAFRTVWSDPWDTASRAAQRKTRMTTFTSNEQNQIPIHTDPEQCSGAKLWHALPGRRCLPHGRSPKGLSRMRRTATQTTHTLADIDALIDSAARARLRLALEDAVQCPSPESVAALQEWPREWVLEEEAAYGAVRDQRNRSPIAATAGARPLQPRALGCEPTTAATDLVVGPGSLTAGTSPRYERVWSLWQRICRQCFWLWKGLAETGGSAPHGSDQAPTIHGSR
jgi:hypothetical protein